MQVSVYDLVITQFKHELNSLKGFLNKARDYAEKKNFDVNVFFATRLAPDMFPLSRQIQITCDSAKGAAARLTGVENPAFTDNEATFDDFIARINKTITFLETFNATQFQGYETRKASFPYYPGKYLEGKDYLVSHAIPNFYFHLTTAYSILRNNGVDVGKADFLGNQNWKQV